MYMVSEWGCGSSDIHGIFQINLDWCKFSCCTQLERAGGQNQEQKEKKRSEPCHTLNRASSYR
jgi:hypothetical protein